MLEMLPGCNKFENLRRKQRSVTFDVSCVDNSIFCLKTVSSFCPIFRDVSNFGLLPESRSVPRPKSGTTARFEVAQKIAPYSKVGLSGIRAGSYTRHRKWALLTEAVKLTLLF